MDKEVGCYSTHLIDGEGTLDAAGLDDFIKQVKLKKCGVSYVVVAIMGPQSSGKSTLLNHLFNTNFKEMNAENGRSQTTKGVWMARCAGIEPCTIVMDLEGNDGAEREDNTAFEKQLALFALAVSDIVLINMWCHDIGRQHASNKPLLKIVFQVMLRLFTPRKTTLLFVVRDKTKSPIERIEHDLKKDMQKIWDSIPKPNADKETQLSEFFNVQVVGLCNYEERKDQFVKQVDDLRHKFLHPIEPGGLAGDRRGVVHASAFSLSAQRIWKTIKENKDLDLPAHKVMVATIRCEEIANDIYSHLLANEKWVELENDVQSLLVLGFGKKLCSLLEECLSSYDKEAAYFDESGRFAKREYLIEKLTQLVQPAYQKMLEHITSGTLKSFKISFTNTLNEGQRFAVAARDCTQNFMTIFDEQCQDADIKLVNCDSTKVRDKFSGDLVSHIGEVREAKLSELITLYETNLKEALYSPVETLLKLDGDDTWSEIRTLLHTETEKAVSQFAISDFEMHEQVMKDMTLELKKYAIGVVESKAREEADNALYLLKERFLFEFNHGADSMPRIWNEKQNIQVITKLANNSCLKLLSVLAAIRLDEDFDTIIDTLHASFANPGSTPLASTTWENVPRSKTLITPVQCIMLWKQVQTETKYTITQANTSQDQYKRRNRIPSLGVAASNLFNAIIRIPFSVPERE